MTFVGPVDDMLAKYIKKADNTSQRNPTSSIKDDANIQEFTDTTRTIHSSQNHKINNIEHTFESATHSIDKTGSKQANTTFKHEPIKTRLSEIQDTKVSSRTFGKPNNTKESRLSKPVVTATKRTGNQILKTLSQADQQNNNSAITKQLELQAKKSILKKTESKTIKNMPVVAKRPEIKAKKPEPVDIMGNASKQDAVKALRPFFAIRPDVKDRIQNLAEEPNPEEFGKVKIAKFNAPHVANTAAVVNKAPPDKQVLGHARKRIIRRETVVIKKAEDLPNIVKDATVNKPELTGTMKAADGKFIKKATDMINFTNNMAVNKAGTAGIRNVVEIKVRFQGEQAN